MAYSLAARLLWCCQLALWQASRAHSSLVQPTFRELHPSGMGQTATGEERKIRESQRVTGNGVFQGGLSVCMFGEGIEGRAHKCKWLAGHVLAHSEGQCIGWRARGRAGNELGAGGGGGGPAGLCWCVEESALLFKVLRPAPQ